MLPRLRRTLFSSTALLLTLACSAGEGTGVPDEDPSSGGTGAAPQGGGANAPSQGGNAGSASGGTGNVSGGSGASSGGSGNVSGGVSGGSAGASGGMTSGGSGGAGTGGAAPGGTGGEEAGGMSGAGGSAGVANGGGGAGGAAGAGAGGAAGKGGAGGAAGNGGAGAGGKAGGSGSGGSSGAAGGGSGGLGAWTNGYVATMYGDINSGDCTAYSSNFTDHTPINTYTCVQGNGPRKVSLSGYSAGQANNASYYVAFGDLSGLWMANGNASPCTCSGSTTATCGGPQCASEISSTGACGVCVAVKCDPSSTFKDNQGYSHNSSCNSTTYVVVQNIDACPHNHTTNVSSAVGWCTDRQSQHIDLSCSGLGDISNLGTRVGQAGWLPVSVQVVPCSVGLGKHSL